MAAYRFQIPKLADEAERHTVIASWVGGVGGLVSLHARSGFRGLS
jgi:hypothetical protein